MRYTLDLISSHSWYFMELSPSTVALTFNPWPSNIYPLLNWLCTIIPSSVSQIHHFDHSSQFQVRYTIPSDVIIFTLKLEIKPCCSPMSCQEKLEALVTRSYLWEEEDGLLARVTRVRAASRRQAKRLQAALQARSPGRLVGRFRTNFILSSQWKEYFGTCFHLFVCLKSTLLRYDLGSIFF